MSSTNELWNSHTEEDWQTALEKYWRFVQPTHLEVEKEFQSIDVRYIREMDARQWYEFLLTKYFHWKYTASNRHATTTAQLTKYLGPEDNLDNLHRIKERIFSFDKDDIALGLTIACMIRGLGAAGASGLLSVLFPTHFATVDQFAVEALSELPDLPEKDAISEMNPEQLTVRDGVILIDIMKRKAKKLNKMFNSKDWSPRKIDMVLWVAAR